MASASRDTACGTPEHHSTGRCAFATVNSSTPRRVGPSLPAVSLLIVLLATPGLARGQAQDTDRANREEAADPAESFYASSYIPLGNWAYPILHYWISAGRITTLSPFVKPYRRMDVARAVLALRREELPSAEAGWLARLARELAPELDVLEGKRRERPSLGLRFKAGAQYWSQTHRDRLRPELEGEFSDDRVFPLFALQLDGTAGPLAGAFDLRRDGIYTNDAQYPEGRVVPEVNLPVVDEWSARIENAYVDLQTRYARVMFGRLYRNWAASESQGFLRSDYAYSQEEIGYRFGTDRIFLTGLFTGFSDFGADTTRYFSAHRLEARPWTNFVIAVSETLIHGGPGENLSFKLINPVGVWALTRDDDETPHNLIGGVDLWWHPLDFLTVYGSWLIDSTNAPRTGTSCCQMGGELSIELPAIATGWIVRLQGAIVESLAYRTSLPWEEYSVERIGLGWDKSDVVIAGLGAQWFALGDLFVEPRLDLQIAGEGDFRQPRPPGEELPDFPRLFVGQRETTVRPAIRGRWRPRLPLQLDVAWDLGMNFISDFEHVPGDDRNEFVGTIRVELETPRFFFSID